MIKKYSSNNCIKVSSMEYISKYKIVNNDYKLYNLLEYNKIKNDYISIKCSYNVYSFIEYLKNNNIKKYFSFNEMELIGNEQI